MIKLEHTVTGSPEQIKFIIEGMRNPLNSWEKSDSITTLNRTYIGKNDYNLMLKLAKAGTDHRKFMRMLPVYVRITAPLYFWKEADTYKVGTVSNSCSTMHKIHSKRFEREDFSYEHIRNCDSSHWMTVLDKVISSLNIAREKYLETEDKKYWWQMIQLLPSSYNQTRNVMLNYEVLANIYYARRNHKLDEWHDFCRWIEELPYSFLITEMEEKTEIEPKDKKEEQEGVDVSFLKNKIIYEEAEYDEATKTTTAYIDISDGRRYYASVKPHESDTEKAGRIQGWRIATLKATIKFLKDERAAVDGRIALINEIEGRFPINYPVNKILLSKRDEIEKAQKIRAALRECYRLMNK